MGNIVQFFKDLYQELKSLDLQTRRVTILIFLTYFLVLFSYPMVRSATGALFYEAYTSAEYSLASFIGVIALMVMIFINNKLQTIYGVHKVYLATGVLTVIILYLSYILFVNGVKEMAFVLFATKNAKIVSYP